MKGSSQLLGESMKAADFFSGEERKEVEDALAKAESRTSGEIVPVICGVSGRYDRAEDIAGILVALVALVAVWLSFQEIAESGAEWAQDVTGRGQVVLGLGSVVGVIVVGFMVGASLATVCPILRLPFIPAQEMREEVDRRALEAFSRFGIGKTKGGTGIMIFVSLFEHRVVVQGDSAISAKLEPAEWSEVCELVLDGIKREEPGAGLRAGVEMCGELLAKHFPVEEGDVNGLANEVRFLD